MKFLHSVFFIFLATSISYCQKYSFLSYSTSEGLPQSQVNAIAQDDDGYLWIGTLGGLARFNGDYFKSYSTDNGLLNNGVSCLSWIEKSLWVGHAGGISIINGSSIKKIALPEKYKTIAVSDIISYKNTILVSLNGGGLFKVENNKLVNLNKLKEEQLFIRDLHVWKDDLYLATREGVTKTSNLKEFSSFHKQLNISMSGIAETTDELVFSSFSDGVFIYNPISKSISQRQLISDEYRIFEISIDHSNTIWLCTQFGVVKLNSKEAEYIDVEKGLPTNTVSCIFEDKDQNIWIGTQGKGLARTPRGELTYFDKNTGINSDLVISGFQTSNGNYYFGTFDIGVVKMTPKKEFKIIPFEFNNTVWAAQELVDGRHWFGTKASLLSMDSNEKIHEFSIEEGTPGYKITCFYKKDNRSMYIGGKEGVVLYSRGEFKEIATNRLEIGTARSIEVIDGILYVGTDLGLFSLVGKKFISVNQIDHTVFNLVKDEKNNLYFGTEDGLYVLRFGKVERIRFANETAANYINFLNRKNGIMYVGTNNGLYILEWEDLTKSPKIIQIGLSDGLVDLETNLNSSFFDSKGHLWFGTSSGLVRFNPKNFKSKTPQIRLKLNEILLNYETFDFSKYSKTFDLNDFPTDLTLPHTENNLLFKFDGISISRFSNLDFQYWLEGLEEGWSPPTKNTSISFSGLAPGDYVLHARILDIYGESKDEVIFKFTIKPPFYATWWFILLMILLIGYFIFSIFQFRIKRAMEKSENEKIEFKARLIALEQQSLNASMNRHFIFNSLNSIQYFINKSDKISANKYLTNFAKLIRKNLDSSNETNTLVTLAQEIERIELYLSLESMRFNDRFIFTIETFNVDLDSIMIPAMLIQPFVENSIIHGVLPNEEKQGEILVKVTEDEHFLTILIEDNGIGIDKSLAQKIHFDGDHKSQGMEITIKRIDLIRKVSFQNLELIGPLQINESNGLINGTRVLLKIKKENLEE